MTFNKTDLINHLKSFPKLRIKDLKTGLVYKSFKAWTKAHKDMQETIYDLPICLVV